MKIADALKIKDEYYEKSVHTEDDDFVFTEALSFLINKTKEPKYMTELAWHYCENKRFDLEIKYLEMAAECGDIDATEELGYMWYYGQHGERDLEKAFKYFSKGDENGSLWCRYKLADMYHHGFYVKKDEAKYREMITEAYEKVKDAMYLNEPLPEIFYRLAGIKVEDGEKDEAFDLLYTAKRFMAERLSYEAFWGHIEVMGRIEELIYKIKEFDEDDFDIYDCFVLIQTPCKVRFEYRDKEYEITMTGDVKQGICFEGKWYRVFSELLEKAQIDGDKLTSVYDEIYILGKETL